MAAEFRTIGRSNVEAHQDPRGADVGVQRYTGYEEAAAAIKVRQRLAPGSQLLLQYQSVRQLAAPRTDRSRPGSDHRCKMGEQLPEHASLPGLAPEVREFFSELE